MTAEKKTNDSLDWLDKNKTLRMDANSHLFNEERRSFHLSRYEFALEYCEDKDVLDAACGTGYGSSLLGELAKSVHGIDLDSDAIEYARVKYGAEKIQFEKSLVENTAFEAGSFDVVVSFETVEHTLCPSAHAMEIARLLKDDGMAIISVPNCWGLTDHHFWDFSESMLVEIFGVFFAEIELFYNNPNNQSGRMKGIGPLDDISRPSAECILAVCRGVNKQRLKDDRHSAVMEEIYESVFRRHRAYLALFAAANVRQSPYLLVRKDVVRKFKTLSKIIRETKIMRVFR